MGHRSAGELAAGLDLVRAAPADNGTVVMVVSRPGDGERQILDVGHLSLSDGLAGDTWNVRTSRRTTDGSPHPDMQLNVINARVSALIADDGDEEHRAMAGDQLHLDLDLSEANLPAGTRLAMGTAIIEITEQPHTGCAKFSQRFGREALRFVNSPEGKALRLRGLNAKVVQPGEIRPGDRVTKAPAPQVAYETPVPAPA